MYKFELRLVWKCLHTHTHTHAHSPPTHTHTHTHNWQFQWFLQRSSILSDKSPCPHGIRGQVWMPADMLTLCSSLGLVCLFFLSSSLWMLFIDFAAPLLLTEINGSWHCCPLVTATVCSSLTFWLCMPSVRSLTLVQKWHKMFYWFSQMLTIMDAL